MTWTGTTSLTCTASDDIDGATSQSTCTQLDADHKCYWVNNADIIINSGQTWSDTNVLLIHKGYSAGGTGMLQFSSATAWAKLGTADLTDENRPILTDGCFYHLDKNGSSPIGGLCAADANGNIWFYGGVFQNEPFNDVGGDYFFCYWPNDQVRVIGVNWTKFGGTRHYGSDFRIQDIKVGGNHDWGFAVGTTADSVGVDSILHYGGEHCYYFSTTQTEDSDFWNVESRDDQYAAYLAPGGYEIDMTNSTEVTTTTTPSFPTNSVLRENSTFDVHCQNESGTSQQYANCRIVRTLRAAGAGAWATDTGSGSLAVPYELALEDTNASGNLTQLQLLRRFWDPTYDTLSLRLRFGGFYITIRKYGFQFEDIAVAPEFGAQKGLVQDYILKANSFITESTQATVDAYTGIAINYSTQTITITLSHTIQQVYDFCQSYATKDAQMPYEIDGLVFTENSGIPGTIEACPITTQDGVLFIVDSSWTFTGAGYIDVNGAIFQMPNGDRYVTVELLGAESGSTYVIENTVPTTLYSGIIDNSGTFSAQRLWAQSNTNVNITVRLQGYNPFVTSGTITSGGLSISVNSAVDLIFQVDKGRLTQLHYRFRNDNGSESTATWKSNEDTDITGVVKNTNLRLRYQIEENRNKPQLCNFKFQYRKVGTNIWYTV